MERTLDHHLRAICFDFGDTLVDEATEVKDEHQVTQQAEMIPGAVEMLRHLRERGYRLAIVSNGPVGNVDNVLSQNGLLDWFEVRAVSDGLGVHKPDPAIFHYALERMGIPVEEAGRVVMLGNHLDRDVKGANQAGLISVWLDWAPHYRKCPFDALEVPRYTIKTPLDLLPLVEHLDRRPGQPLKLPVLIHHMANRGRRHPPGSLPAVEACLKAGARIIEIDLTPTADGHLVLLHGPGLEEETTGRGAIHVRTAAEVAQLRRLWRGAASDVPVGRLQDAVELLRSYPVPAGGRELQLDLKPDAPLTSHALERMVRALEPVRDQVRVTTGGDWLLRRLHALDPDLPLGFDPLLYLDYRDPRDGTWHEPPFRVGAYGYYDEHLLASRRWGSTADYLAARADSLYAAVPPRGVWYIYARMLAQALDDGFDWIAYLHARGALVDTWTLDPDHPAKVDLARRLAAQDVDRITSNDAPGMAEALDGQAAF